MPRWLGFSAANSSSVELHGFGDASQTAYGCVVYIRVSSGSAFQSNLVVAKTRLCPSKSLTIPKLELMAALIVSRMLICIANELSIDSANCYGWSDSQVCLAWISATDKIHQTFVQNRVSEIRQHILPSNWHYISTLENPADFTSRVLPVTDWINKSLWWNGPDRLRSGSWLEYSSKVSFQSSNDTSSIHEWTVADNCGQPNPSPLLSLSMLAANPVLPTIDFSRFSQYNRLLHCVAYVYRFKNVCNGIRPVSPNLSAAEIENAEKKIVIQCQYETFPSKAKSRNMGRTLVFTVIFHRSSKRMSSFGVSTARMPPPERKERSLKPYTMPTTIISTFHPIFRYLEAYSMRVCVCRIPGVH